MINDITYERGLGQSIDWKLIGCYLLLVLIGWLNIYASIHSTETAPALDFATRSGKQFVWILTSLGLAGLILFVIPASWWQGLSLPIYIGVVILLVAVIFLGVEVKGSRSWFAFGPVRFQPAEISKISTSLLLALLMSRPDYKMSRLRDFGLTMLVIGLPMLVILGEKETGSALVYIGFIFVLYREGFSGWLLALVGLAILLFITTLTLSPYASLLILAGILFVCNIPGRRKDLTLWLTVGVALLALLGFLPSLWGAVQARVAARVDLLENMVGVVPASGEKGYFWAFLLKIKPIHFMLAALVSMVPVAGWVAYRDKDNFLGLSVAAMLLGVVLVFSTEFIFEKVLQDHQRKRIEVLLGMKEDPSGVGYNVNQSMIAIGSGGLTGKGYLHGTQTTYGFVPEQSTDFIFCTVGEEWGFVGCLAVILLYVFLICRLILDAEQCREHFTRIYGYCAAACVFMHLFINVGMTIGLMPVIGIPLPLLSYGGSSLWSFTVLIFIFIALYRQEKKYF